MANAFTLAHSGGDDRPEVDEVLVEQTRSGEPKQKRVDRVR